jgi:hypothetical protein
VQWRDLVDALCSTVEWWDYWLIDLWYWRVGGTYGWSGEMWRRKILLSPPASEPQIVQTIASHYTNMLSPFTTQPHTKFQFINCDNETKILKKISLLTTTFLFYSLKTSFPSNKLWHKTSRYATY